MLKFKQYLNLFEQESSPEGWNSSDNEHTVHVFVSQPPGNRMFTSGHARDLMDTAKRLSGSLKQSQSYIHIGVPRAKQGEGDYSQREIDEVAQHHFGKVFGNEQSNARLTPGSNMGGDVSQQAVAEAKAAHPGKNVVLHLITGHDQRSAMEGYGKKMLNQAVPEFKDPGMKVDEVHTHVPDHTERMQVNYTDKDGVPQSVSTSGTNFRAASREGDRERASAILGYNGKHLDSIMQKAAQQERPSDKKAKKKS
jgi:hypothetical protein